MKCDICSSEIEPNGPLHGWGSCALSDVMVDIETLGVSKDAAIMQIAAVRFDPRGSVSSPSGAFNFHVKPTGRAEVDGQMDIGTVLWWLRQSKAAQQRVFEPAIAAQGDVGEGVARFCHWLTNLPFRRVWACGPQFDLSLLKAALQRTNPGTRWPIPYGAERDFRTLRDVGTWLGVKEPIRVGVEHDALDDAFHQAGYAIEIAQAIERGKT